MASPFHIKEHIIPAAHIREFARATSLSQDEELSQHVKQYIPKDNPNPKKGDITIIGAHANGFPKELYEPLWEDMYKEAKANGVRIRSIYIADAAWQGQSGILNRSLIGNDPSWNDYARDIIHMINTLRPARPLVGIGHSFGGAAIINVSLSSPRIFSSIVLLDPVISKYSSVPGDISAGPATASIYRRDVWPSREEAIKAFRRSPFYKGWDERVFKRWTQYGINPVEESQPAGKVTLTTTKHQEVFTYLRPSWEAFDEKGLELINPDKAPDVESLIVDNQAGGSVNANWPLYRAEPPATLKRLPFVRPPVLYIFGHQSYLSPPELREEKLRVTGTGVGGSGGVNAGRVKAVGGEENGHLIPMEDPQYCAKEALQWIKEGLKSWEAEEKEFEAWARKSQAEKVTISEEYITRAGRPAKKETKSQETQTKAKI